MEVSRYTRISRRREKIAKSVIWGAVVITLMILAWIILYVMVRGFVSNQEILYNVSSLSEPSLVFGDQGEYEMQVIVNRKVRLKDLTMEDLRTIYTKPRRENWGPYTLQDRKVSPYAFSYITVFGSNAMDLIAGPGMEFGAYVTYCDGSEEIIRAVAEDKGAIGFLPADITIKDKNVRIIPVRRIVFAVNPQVKEVFDNKQLLSVSESDLNKIISGEISNWQEVGGRDLEIEMVYFPDNDITHSGLNAGLESISEKNDKARTVSSFTDFTKTIAVNPGAGGLCYFDEAAEAGLTVMEVSRKEVRGNLTLSFLLEAPARSGKWGGISTIIINTLFLIIFTLIFAAPVGILAAIYLVEYAQQGPLVSVLRMGTETLAGVPSIIFGLFGNIFFVNMLGMGIGFISSTLTITMMILPTIIRTSEEALKAVPLPYREGSLALGATKLQTIFKVVLPAAVPGILTGLILGIGRVVGETAVLLYTLGSNYELVRGLSSSARVLSLHLYFLFSEAISFDRAFATGAILIFIVLLVNFSTTKLISRTGKMSGIQ